MGQKISQIAYNEEFEDLQTQGLSKTQVSLIQEHFYSICESCNRQDKTLDAKIISNLLKIPKKEAQLVVDFADIDGDGKLNDYDFVCLIGLFTKAPLQDKLEGVFYLFDEDYSQLISEKELENLVRCILCVNEDTTNVQEDLVEQKKQEILSAFFCEEKELKISEFLTLAKEDFDFQTALKKLGVIQEEDFDLNYNEDLEEEFNKGQDEFRDENYDNIKNGLEVVQEGIFTTEQIQADEFMAVKPFLGAVKNSVPSNFNSEDTNLNEPNANLNLEFVHGYRCFDTRNNIHYIDEENILFHSAAVGINMNIIQRKQKFNFGNSDDIISIAKHNDIVATGQIGHKPVINLWSCQTQETFSIIVGDLQKGIAHLAISHDGKYLAGTAMNDEHDIAVYDISNVKDPKLVNKTKGVRDIVLDLKFSKDNKQLILASKKELYFANVFNKKIRINKASGWSKQKPMSLVIAFLQSVDCIVGLNNGNLAIIKGNSVSKQIKAHKGCIYAMKNNQDLSKLFTGGADGKVLIFDNKLNVLQEVVINSDNFRSINPKIRALDFNEEHKKLLIGTRGGEIIEYDIQQQQKQFILQGHFSQELWGLAVHPFNDEYVTVGEDFLMAKWSINKRENLLSKKLKFQSNTISISPQGTQIAIGCKNGYLIVHNYSNFKIVQNKRVSQKELTQVKFSPCGKFLAVGSRDSKIYIFETSNKFKRISICKGHHSTITHLDFSEDSQILQSNCTSYELLYWNVKSGKQDTRGASNNRDEKWASWTCVLGWPVQGIFPPCSDGTDVNSVDRNKTGKIIATGDDFGNVKLFQCPNFKGSSYQKFTGHSSHVTNVRFTSAQNHLISVGGNDKSIFQWKFKNFDQDQEQEEEYEEDEDDSEYLNLPQEEMENTQQFGMFDVEEEEAVEFMANKPWIGDLQNSIPSDFQYQKGMEDAPQETLQLHYVNGYRCFDTRYAARIQDQDNVVFISAALGVQMNHQKNTQSFFNEHEEDLVSFDLHPNREIAVSGQMAMKGKSKFIDIFVWEIQTKKVLANLTGFHLRAIQQLKFSPSGENLFSFGKDDDNSLAVYDWKNQRLIATAKVDKKNVLDISFVSENEFLTVGSKHIKSWRLNGTKLQGQRVAWKGSCKPESILCCQGIPKFGYVIGTIKGKLIPVRGAMGKPLQAHQGKIYVMFYNQQDQTLLTGGQDGFVKQFSLKGNLKEIQTLISINSNESLCPKIRAIDIHQEQLLIGTGASELFMVENYQNQKFKKKILDGHFQGELWGLSCHPNSDFYATCGDDGTVRIWSALKRKQIKVIQLQEKLRAISYNNDGTLIACASYSGKIYLLNENLEKLQTIQSNFTKQNQWIEDIKFSPDNQFVAFGAHGGASKLQILKLTAQNQLKKYAMINAGITSALLHLDWSEDSSQIALNSQAYELKFVDVFAKKQTRASSVKDQQWHTWTCKLGFLVQGIYPGVDGTDVNTVDRSSSQKILATGDDFQLVKLFKCPSVQPKSCYNSYKGHSSHVTRVRFLQQDKFLISTGGNDKTNIIWKVVTEDDVEEEDDEEIEAEFVQKKQQRNKYGYDTDENEQEDLVEEIGGFQIEHVEETEFMAVKPWLGAIKQPSDFVCPEPDQNEKPNLQVSLEYVYGYRSKDCRNNLFLANQKLFYFAAALGIQLDFDNNTQQHFNMHRDDVIAMAYDKNKGIFATGELGPKPWICLWQQNTMQLLMTLKEGIIKGIQCLKFSPDGSKIVAVCIDDNNMVVLFDVSQQKMIALEKGDTAKIVDVEWISDSEFVTVGMRHFKQWKVQNNSLKSSRGSFKKGSSDKIVFAKNFNGKIFCGAFKGELQIWNGSQCSRSIKLGKGSVDAICLSESGLIFVGGKQKKVFVFDQSLRQKNELDLSKFLFQAMSLQVRSLQVNATETELFIGTYSSQIFRIYEKNQQKISEFSNLQNLVVEELMTGHYARNLKWTNEIWGLFPLKNDKFLTVSDDAVLRMWSSDQRKQIQQLELNIDKKGAKLEREKVTKDLQEQAKLRSVAVSENQKFVAVGCKEGSVRIIDLKKWKQVKILKKRKRWIQTLRFSPDDSKLAVGSHDCFIDIYDVNQNFKILHKMKKHSSFITHLDWSEDSQFLHSTCGAYELLFWDAVSGQQLTRGASALRDEKWATWSCVLGWPVQGVFKPEWDGSDVNMIDRSHKQIADGYQVIACADDFSEIRLYKFPCLDKVTEGLRLRGHSSHVTNVKFNFEDTYLYSTGGEDQCVMQWKIL